MPKKEEKSVTLIVSDAYKMDVGRGVVRIDSAAMETLGIVSGDAVSIKGKSEAVAIAWRIRSEDEGRGIIRMDAILRHNAGASIGDKVEVRKIEPSEAKEVVIGPIEAVRFSGDPTHYFHEKLMNKVVLRNTKLAIDVMGTTLHYVVTKTNPKGPVIITPETKLIVSEKQVKAEAMRIPEVTYEDIGGLKEEIAMIREMVELPMKHPEICLLYTSDAADE